MAKYLNPVERAERNKATKKRQMNSSRNKAKEKYRKWAEENPIEAEKRSQELEDYDNRLRSARASAIENMLEQGEIDIFQADLMIW